MPLSYFSSRSVNRDLPSSPLDDCPLLDAFPDTFLDDFRLDDCPLDLSFLHILNQLCVLREANRVTDMEEK